MSMDMSIYNIFTSSKNNAIHSLILFDNIQEHFKIISPFKEQAAQMSAVILMTIR